jgi:hypothetical protein
MRTPEAKERSSYRIPISFKDELGEDVTPNSIKWTMIDGNNLVVNSREDVVIAPAASVNIILYGDDLAVDETAESRKRTVIVEADYVSSLTLGLLPINDSVEFDIRNLPVIENPAA